MNLWVSSEPFNPATYYSEARARHRRLRTPERRQDAPPVTKPVVVVMNEREGLEIAAPVRFPARSRPARSADSNAHVLAWLQYNTSEEAAVPYPTYIKMRCRQLGVDHADVCGLSRAKHIIAAKHLIMFEVRSRYGISLPQIGRAFGVDHTSVGSALKKHGLVPSRVIFTPEQSAEMKRLASEGIPYAELARIFGHSATGIRLHVDQDAYRDHLQKRKDQRRHARELKQAGQGS